MKVLGSALVFLTLNCIFVKGTLSIFKKKEWEDIKIRFDQDHSNGYYQVPKTTTDSLIGNYVKADPEAGFKLPIDFYCYPDDPRVCLMFDKKGNLVGIQTSFLEEDLANIDSTLYDYSVLTNFIKTNFFNIPAYSFRSFFTDPEKLTSEGRKNTEKSIDGLWFYLEGLLYPVPSEEPEGESFGEFYKQGCVPFMGKHYFYQLPNLNTCEKLFLLFVQYENKKLIGFGLAGIGTGKIKERNWYEHPTTMAIDYIAPNRPPCMNELTSKFGITSIHIYFVNKPLLITCLANSLQKR